MSWLLELAVRSGELENFKALVTELVESAQSEQGTLNYEWSINDDGNVIHLYERFADSAALVTHMTTFGEKFAQRFLAAVEPTRFTVYGTPSSEAKDTLAGLGPMYMAPLGGFARP